MSKYTPGPWSVQRRRDGVTIAPVGVVMFGASEDDANAKLIAAAPELAEALDLPLELAEKWADGGGRMDPAHDICQAARDALAKAGLR